MLYVLGTIFNYRLIQYAFSPLTANYNTNTIYAGSAQNRVVMFTVMKEPVIQGGSFMFLIVFGQQYLLLMIQSIVTIIFPHTINTSVKPTSQHTSWYYILYEYSLATYKLILYCTFTLKGITELQHSRINDVAPYRLIMTWTLRQMTLKQGRSGAKWGYTVLSVCECDALGAEWKKRMGCPLLNSSKNILVASCVFDCLEWNFQHFTRGGWAPTHWVTFFLTAALETKRSSKYCSRHTAFLPSAASMQIRALELFFVSNLQLLLLTTLQKWRRCSWIWISLNGRVGW